MSAHVDTFAHDNLPPREQWPEFLLDDPRFAYPSTLNAGAALLDDNIAAGNGPRTAIITPERRLTYDELLAETNRIANVLVAAGLVPGNRLLLRGYNNDVLAAVWLAALKAGLVVVTTMPLLRAKELCDVIELGRVEAAVCDARLADEMLQAQQRCPALRTILMTHTDAADGLAARAANAPTTFTNVPTASDDVAMIAFTSGTTGKPKGTMHFHRDVLAICDAFPPLFAPTHDDVFMGTPPFAFTFGLGVVLLFPLRYGAAALLLEKSSPEILLDAIPTYGVTILSTAPTSYRAMTPLVDRTRLATLRACISAGEALPAATRAAWETASGVRIIDGIGSTEMLHIFIAAAGDAIRPGATGVPVPGYIACVMDDDGNPLPPGNVGRLAVKGPTGCRYLNDARQRDYVQNGWNMTGDAYLMDDDGYFWYQARTDDMIVSSGYNIAGPDVESALLEHETVLECAVVGVPDSERGQIVKAFVVTREGTHGDAALVRTLQDFVKSRIAPYKYPRAIEFCRELPRTQTGKLQRFRLRDGEVAQ